MKCIGVMTGNSLDAVDVVITEFAQNHMRDICGHSHLIPLALAQDFRLLKERIKQTDGHVRRVFDEDKASFMQLHDSYIHLVAQTISETLDKAGLNPQDIEIIGFHGQTCAHCPPSIAKGKPYTVQVGSGQMLADLTGIKVAYDFRSDDVLNGGEGAPLAPVHNMHLALNLRKEGIFPVAFCNGGNTGNISLITTDKNQKIRVLGWDTGPFNHFADMLTLREKGEPYDKDGKYGAPGNLNEELLRTLFEQAVVTESGKNYLMQPPPKSSDPAWYRFLPEMMDGSIPFCDRLRTVEFFSAYAFVYNLKYIPADFDKPSYFLTFGGGWNNPVVQKDFERLLHGKAKALPEHQAVFETIANPKAIVTPASKFGSDSRFMEARIFADMAWCLLQKEPFSYPETTGCREPVVGGIVAVPNGGDKRLWSRAALD